VVRIFSQSPKTPPCEGKGQRTIADEQLSGRAHPALLPGPLERPHGRGPPQSLGPARDPGPEGAGLWQSTHYPVRFFAPLCRPGRGRRGEAWPLHFFKPLVRESQQSAPPAHEGAGRGSSLACTTSKFFTKGHECPGPAPRLRPVYPPRETKPGGTGTAAESRSPRGPQVSAGSGGLARNRVRLVCPCIACLGRTRVPGMIPTFQFIVLSGRTPSLPAKGEQGDAAPRPAAGRPTANHPRAPKSPRSLRAAQNPPQRGGVPTARLRNHR
jgi:hypothetical protein